MKEILFFLAVFLIPIFLPAISADTNVIIIKSIEDTLVADNAQPGNKTLEDQNFGELPFIRMQYKLDGTRDGDNIGTFGLIKFDLLDLKARYIEDAKLVMTPYEVYTIKNETVFNIYPILINWKENQVTWNTKPVFSWLDKVQEKVTQPNKKVIWDVTGYVMDKADSILAFAIGFDRASSGKEEIVFFYSKETENPDNAPYLQITYSDDVPEIYQEPNVVKPPILKIKPTDDAFVVANLSDPQNVEGNQSLNTGDLEYLRSWYAWNVTEHQEKLVTSTYLKFDLAEIDSEGVLGAQLKLEPFVVKSSIGIAPTMDLTFVPDNNWSELEITYEQRPPYSENFTKISSVITEDERYSWDLTDLVKENAGSELSIAFAIRDIYTNNEELITFHSKEAEDPENFPVLEIEYAAAIPPIPSSLQENETDYTLAAIVGVLVAAAAGIGIFIALILRKKSPKQLTPKQVTTTPSEKPRTDSQKQKPSQERKCKLCGKALVQDFKVCPYCGYRV